MTLTVTGQEYTEKTHTSKKGETSFEVKLLRSALGEQIADVRRRRDEHIITTLANGRGSNLTRDQVIQRASMERTFKDRRIWVRTKTTDREIGEFFCLGFDAPDMHARCVDRSKKLRVFDPNEVEFETRSERTLRFAKERSKRLDQDVRNIQLALAKVVEEKDRIDKMIRRTDNEVAREKKRSHLDRFIKQGMEE